MAKNFHDKQCFVVMPYGQDTKQQRWFQGWYEQVIESGVRKSGYTPVLSALENTPNAINDEIRLHLALDAMVVVDLGGFKEDDDPNPNVMYELGIRHALNLPVVIMGWKNQKLPFDISNQRILLVDRDFVSIKQNVEILASFIMEAKDGAYYKPMDAVIRADIFERVDGDVTKDILLKAVVDEIKDWKDEINKKRIHKWSGSANKRRKVTGYLGSKSEKKILFEKFIEKGGTQEQWMEILSIPVDDELYNQSVGWSITQWREYVFSQINEV